MGAISRLIRPFISRMNRHIEMAGVEATKRQPVWGEVPDGTPNDVRTWFGPLDHVPRNDSDRVYVRGLRRTRTLEYLLHGRWVELLVAPRTGTVGFMIDYEWDASLNEDGYNVITMTRRRKRRTAKELYGRKVRLMQA